MKILVINNIASGFYDGSVYDFLRTLLQDGDHAVVRCTDGTTTIRSLLTDADKFDAVVAAGGDGTVSAVAYHLAFSGIPILPFPAGTANLLANNLLSPLEPHALAKLIRNPRTLDFDLGEIVAEGKHIGFGVMAGAGYDATIMNAAKPAKKLLGQMAYFQAAIMNALPSKSKIVLDIDDTHIETEGLGILLVNFSKIQFDITLTHGNEPRDGTFDVIILKAQNAFGLIPALVAGLLDRDGEFPGRSDSLEIHRAHEVRAYADPPMFIQYDGEVPGMQTPFTARIMNRAARFIVCDEGYEQFSESLQQ